MLWVELAEKYQGLWLVFCFWCVRRQLIVMHILFFFILYCFFSHVYVCWICWCDLFFICAVVFLYFYFFLLSFSLSLGYGFADVIFFICALDFFYIFILFYFFLFHLAMDVLCIEPCSHQVYYLFFPPPFPFFKNTHFCFIFCLFLLHFLFQMTANAGTKTVSTLSDKNLSSGGTLPSAPQTPRHNNTATITEADGGRWGGPKTTSLLALLGRSRSHRRGRSGFVQVFGCMWKTRCYLCWKTFYKWKEK